MQILATQGRYYITSSRRNTGHVYHSHTDCDFLVVQLMKLKNFQILFAK